MEISVSILNFVLWSPIFRDWFFVMTYDSVKTYGFRETSRWCFSYLSTKGFDTFYGYGHLTCVCISWVYIGTKLFRVASIFWPRVSFWDLSYFGFTKNVETVSYQNDKDLVHIRSCLCGGDILADQRIRAARTKIDKSVSTSSKSLFKPFCTV